MTCCLQRKEARGMGTERKIMNMGGMSREEINARLRAIGERDGIPGGEITPEKV